MNAPSVPYGRVVLFWFLGFFGVVIVVNILLARAAIRTQPGLVTDHPYERGLAYNQLIASEEKQRALGWESSIIYRDGMLRFVLVDGPQKKALRPDSVQAYFTRPADASLDFVKPLKDGKALVAFPAPGLWQVRVEAMVGGVPYQRTERLVIE